MPQGIGYGPYAAGGGAPAPTAPKMPMPGMPPGAAPPMPGAQAPGLPPMPGGEDPAALLAGMSDRQKAELYVDFLMKRGKPQGPGGA